MANQNTLKTDSQVIKDQIQVLSIAEGFYHSSVLFALLKLDIFERIGETDKTLNDLATEIDADPDTLLRLLNAGVMLKLLETEDGSTFRLAPACRSVLLSSAGENYIGNWIRLQKDFCYALLKLDEAILRSGPTIEPSTYLGGDKERTREYTLAMHNYAALRGKQLAHFLDTTGCETVLDIGCGAGTFAYHLGMRNPNLRLYLLDMPEVLEVAKEVRSRYGIENEVHFLPLDAAKDDIPGTYDMILASNMLHSFSAQERRHLIERLYRLLNPGGSLVVQSQYLREDHRGGRWPIFVDLNLLCTTRNGKNHSVEETRKWLEEAGFGKIEYSPMSIYDANSFLRGYKT